MDEDAPKPERAVRIGRYLIVGSLIAGAASAATGLVPAAWAASPALLILALALLAGGAASLARRTVEDSRPASVPTARFRREATVHAGVLALNLAFLLLAFVELLTVPAALGRLKFFGAVAEPAIQWYPLLLFGLLALLGFTLLRHAGMPLSRPLDARTRIIGYVALAAAGLFAVAALAVQVGLLGLEANRAFFVLAGGEIAVYVFVATWARLPAFQDVLQWMEHEERLHDSNFLRNASFAFLALTGASLVAALVARFGILPPGVALVGLASAMLFLVPATLVVGVKRFIAAIHADPEGSAGETRARAKVILNAFAIGITAEGVILGIATFLAFLAQVAGVTLFDSLLAVYVAEYPIILTLALVPVAALVVTRTRVASELKYTDARKAVTVIATVLVVVLASTGIALGSGVAEGEGFEIGNGVIVMAAGVIALIAFVHARALLPTVMAIARESVKVTEEASSSLKEDIRRRMMATYIVGLLFVLSFVGFIAATSLGALPAPGEGMATDSIFFLYLIGGLVLLFLIGIRYFQGVNIDPSWKKKDDAEVGKKRLTASELQKYIVLGFSGIVAGLLFLMGIFVRMGVISNVGPVAIDPRYATDFFVFAILLGLGPYGYYHNHELKRTQAIDSKFPDFLRDLAESQRAGMTLTESVITASKGNYGVLTGEIRKMAAQIEWGVSFSDALRRFSKRVNTPLIERTVSLIVQASKAGGNVVDVLTAAADDAREIQMILKERKQSMSIYVMIIYIAFFVFMGVIGVLNAQFIPEVHKAVSEAAKGGTVAIGGLTLAPFDQQEFKTLFFHAAVIQGFGGGLVAGVMEGGKPQSGLRHAFVMVSLAYVIFRFLIGG